MKNFFGILFSLLLLPAFAGELSFSAFHPVSEFMTVKTPFLSCRFVKHHAFPAKLIPASGQALPWFGFADSIIRKSDKSSFRTEHDYWSKFKADPREGIIETRALFCRRVWKPHPQPFPGAEAVYRYRFSKTKGEIEMTCHVKIKKDPDLRLNLLTLQWPKDTAPRYVLSPDKTRAELHFPQAVLHLTGESLAVTSDKNFLKIAPRVQWQKDSAVSRLFLSLSR